MGSFGEPWRWEPWVALTGGGRSRCLVRQRSSGPNAGLVLRHEALTWEITDRDASRIVSCVNALAGVAEPEEALEKVRLALKMAPWHFATKDAELLTCLICGVHELQEHAEDCVVGAALRALSPDNHGAARGGEEESDG